MLNKVNNINVETYNVFGDYYVDIVTKDDEYRSWIYSNRYGIKTLMFGGTKKQVSYEKFLEIVEANLIEYLNDYVREVEDKPFTQDDLRERTIKDLFLYGASNGMDVYDLREIYNKLGIEDEELDEVLG